MLAWLRIALFENLGLKAFSLLLASCLLLYVRADQHVFSTVEVKLEFKYPPDMLLVSRPVKYLSVTLHGASSKIRRIDPRLAYTLDLSKHPEGTHQQEIFLEQIRPLFPTVRVTRITPSVLDFRFEKALTKTLKVTVRTKGSKEGYSTKITKVTPETITLRGPKNDLDKKTEILTEPLDLAPFEPSHRSPLLLPLEALPASVEILKLGKTAKVSVQIEVSLLLSERTFSDVPIRLGYATPPFLSEIQPPTLSQLSLKGPLIHLRRLQPEHLSLLADGRKLPSKPGTYTLPLVLNTPEASIETKSPLPPVSVTLSPRPLPRKAPDPRSLPDAGQAEHSTPETSPEEGSQKPPKGRRKKRTKKDPSPSALPSPPERRLPPPRR